MRGSTAVTYSSEKSKHRHQVFLKYCWVYFKHTFIIWSIKVCLKSTKFFELLTNSSLTKDRNCWRVWKIELSNSTANSLRVGWTDTKLAWTQLRTFMLNTVRTVRWVSWSGEPVFTRHRSATRLFTTWKESLLTSW